jgi:3-phenylpropionate/trans-cinnamate dioxygenase alpha subunit
MIRLWHPRGPTKTELWSWCIVDKSAPKEVKDAMRVNNTLTFSPAGIVEQDDMSNWMQCTAASTSWKGKQFLANVQLGLGHESVEDGIPGRIAPAPSEANQRGFYARWAELMDAPSWDRISHTHRPL